MLNNLEEYNRKIRQDLLIEYRGLEFYTTWGLFSPRTIDDGSRLLLDHLDPRADPQQEIARLAGAAVR